jgi:hypothetical protein
MRKDQVGLANAVAWIPESKTPNGVAEVPLTEIAVKPSEANWRSRVTDRGCFHVIAVRLGTNRASRRLGRQPYATLGYRIFGFMISVPPTQHV